MKLSRFEDLQCWQEARKLVNMVYDAMLISGLITYLRNNESRVKQKKPEKPKKL
jgi:hypothetical protein